MAEPATSAVATLAASAGAIPLLTAFGVPLGLRADILLAGFCGALVAIVLLNTVPSVGDTWRLLLKTTFQRMAVTVTSAITAGYTVPGMLHEAVSLPTMLLTAFVIGAGAQKILAAMVTRFADRGALK